MDTEESKRANFDDHQYSSMHFFSSTQFDSVRGGGGECLPKSDASNASPAWSLSGAGRDARERRQGLGGLRGGEVGLRTQLSAPRPALWGPNCIQNDF